MEKLTIRRNALAIGIAMSSLLLSACSSDSEPSSDSEIATPAGAYDLKLTTIGEVDYDSDEGEEKGIVFEYTYVKDGVRTTCSAIHTDGINETGLAGSCRFEPIGEQPVS